MLTGNICVSKRIENIIDDGIEDESDDVDDDEDEIWRI